MKKIKQVKKPKTDLYFVLTGDLLLEERYVKTGKILSSQKLDDTVKEYYLHQLIKDLEMNLERWAMTQLDLKKASSHAIHSSKTKTTR